MINFVCYILEKAHLRATHSEYADLLLYTNKLKGTDTIRQTYIIRQSFSEIDNVIYYLENEYFSSQWSTGRVWLCTLMSVTTKTSALSMRTANKNSRMR